MKRTQALVVCCWMLFVGSLGQKSTVITEAALQNAEQELYQDFLVTARVPLLQSGEKFPPIKNLTTKKDFVPNGWSLVVVGGATCNTCDQIQVSGSFKKMRMNVYHFSDSWSEKSQQPYTVLAKNQFGGNIYDLKNTLGIVLAPGYFIVAPDKKIVFTRYSYLGKLTPLEEITTAINNLAIQKKVPSLPVLKPKTKLPNLAIKKFNTIFSKKGTSVLFFSEDRCDICKSGLFTFKSKLARLELPKTTSIFYIQVGLGGQGEISGKTPVEEVVDPKGVVSSALQVTRWPQVVIVRDGRFVGRVDYAKILKTSSSDEGDDSFFFKVIERAVKFANSTK